MLSVPPLSVLCITSFGGVHYLFPKGPQVADPAFRRKKLNSRRESALILHMDTFITPHFD